MDVVCHRGEHPDPGAVSTARPMALRSGGVICGRAIAYVLRTWHGAGHEEAAPTSGCLSAARELPGPAFTDMRERLG